MLASTQAREGLLAANAKAKERIADLQAFVRRFSANASKARQATSRRRLIEKIKVEDIKPSSRQYPFIRFDIEERDKIHRHVLEVQKLAKGYDRPLFSNFNIRIEAGERIAIIGPNGIGKTTLLRCLLGEDYEGGLAPDAGHLKWTEKAHLGYCAQDQTVEFSCAATLVEWMGQWKSVKDNDQTVRATLGRLLFSGDEAGKRVEVISGGERQRLIFGKLMLQKPNVLLLDEPTNHLDMESIESLNTALDNYKGTLIFVSHDREFVSSLATRIIEMTPAGINIFAGNYDDFLKARTTAGI
jgi:ATPase subunit of ABC transporter with duplicated ATPase domains